MEKLRLEQAMRIFVGNDVLRPIFHKPYKQEGFYYATDAHALIRVVDSFILDFEFQEKPNTKDVIKPSTHEPIEIDLVELEKHLDSVTPEVADTYECPDCNGYGTEECNLGHDHDCETCDGEGSREYNPVRFVKDRYAKYKIWNGVIARNQLQKMFDACKILGIEKINKTAGEGNKQYKFETPEILFLIMPIMNTGNEEYIKTKY